MPYRHLHIWLLLLVPLVGLAFLPNYFSIFRSASWSFHIHAATASAWIALLAFQSWSIHGRRTGLHRAAGMASLAVFPLFFAGSLLILHSMATKVATGSDPFYGPFGAQLAAIDSIATIAIGWFYWAGLRARRNVQRHARWLTATVLFLLMPIFARLTAIVVPGLMIRGPEDFHLFPHNVRLANFIVLAIALWLAARSGRDKRPMLAAAALTALQALLFEVIPGIAQWESLLVAVSRLPAAALFSAGLGAGAVLAWLGWAAVPPRPARPPQPA